MEKNAVKKIYRGVTSYLQYWNGYPVDRYYAMQPEADFYSTNIPYSVNSDTYSKWNTFKYCSKVKITLNVTKASTSTNSVWVYVTYRNGASEVISNTNSIKKVSITVDAKDIRIMYSKTGINTASGQVGTVTFEPIR